MPPNVLLVVLDAARRDALEPYGAPTGATPVIADLARQGRALPEVYATACWTVPSHASMFTGLMPRAAGLARVGSPNGAKPVVEAHRDRFLPEVLRRAGYATCGVSANLWVSEASGYSTGFDDFSEVHTGRHGRFDLPGLRDRARWLAEAVRGRVDDGADNAAHVLDRLLEQPPTQPFFWFVNLIECHSPYLPPRGYGDVSLIDRMRAADEARRHYNLDAIWRACAGGFDIPEASIERSRRLYAGAIAYMDDWLGRRLEQLDAAGVLDDTVVIVTSDHGENFGEGGFVAHAMSLDNRLIHVPFVIAGPGTDGRGLTSLAELPRLVAELAELSDHPWTDGPPAGVGVAQFEPLLDPGDPRADDAVERWGLGEEAMGRLTTPMTCAVRDGLKLLRRGDAEELYDLRADPLELAPLADGADREGVAEVRAALEHPAVTARRDPESSAATGEASAEELREIEERMRLLGYM